VPKPVPLAPPGPPGRLAAALAGGPAPRRPRGWRPERAPLPLVGLLQVAVAAMLCGARRLYAVAQWGRERGEDDPAVLVPLGLPPGRSPSVATLHRVFKALAVAAFERALAVAAFERALAVAAFERALGGWLATSGVRPDAALALDGKTLRGIHGDTVPGVHLVAACAHRAGAVLGEAASPGQGQELAAVKAVVGQVPLAGRLVTGDALLTQRDVWAAIVAGKGDYLLPGDDNQPTLLAACEAAFSPMDADRPRRLGRADRAALADDRVGAAGGRADGGDPP
jgi:hypothetical protein